MNQEHDHDHNNHHHQHARCLLKFYLQAFIISINIGSVLGILSFFYHFLLSPFDPHALIASVIGGFVDGFVVGFGFLLILIVIWSLYDKLIDVFFDLVFHAQLWRGVLDRLAGILERQVRALRFQRL